MRARLVLITDATTYGPAATIARAREACAAAAAGAVSVQLREKAMSARARWQLARALRDALPASTPLWINGAWDLALAVGATGVHLSEAATAATAHAIAALTAELAIGVSGHHADRVPQAPARQWQLGPIHATPSKAAYGPPLGLEALTIARGHLQPLASPPWLVAVGGFDDAQAARAAIDAGADAVACIRAWYAAADVGRWAATMTQIR